jgi:hypothetical protein
LAELDVDKWMDADDPLTADKTFIESRIKAHEKTQTAVPWEELDVRLKQRLGE